MYTTSLHKTMLPLFNKALHKSIKTAPQYTSHRFLSASASQPFKFSPFTQSTPLPRSFSTPLHSSSRALQSPPLFISRRLFQIPDPKNIKPNVKSSPEDRMNQFIGKSDPRALKRVDSAAQQVIQQTRSESERVTDSGSSGGFYLVSRLVFAFETWTILFFGGVLVYYIHSVMKYREDSPLDIANRIWDNFIANSSQYRDVLTGKKDLKQFREEFLKDELTLHPNNTEALNELDEIQRAKRVRQIEHKKKQEATALAEWDVFSQEVQAEQKKIDLNDMQKAFEQKMKELQSSGKEVTEQDLLDFITEHNAKKHQLENGIKSQQVEQQQTQSQRRRFE